MTRKIEPGMHAARIRMEEHIEWMNKNGMATVAPKPAFKRRIKLNKAIPHDLQIQADELVQQWLDEAGAP